MSVGKGSHSLVKNDPLSLYMAQVNRFPLLSKEEEYTLAKRYKEYQDPDTAHSLVCANLRFVVKIAHEYKSYGFRVLDLIQEGNIGLMQAVKKFDPDKGYRFISYAVWWIRAYIQNYILKMWSLVKLGTTQAQRKLFYSLRKLTGKLQARDGEADTETLAQTLHVSQHDVEEMGARMAGRDFSLDAHLNGEESGATHMDMLRATNESQETLLIDEEEKEDRKAVVGELLQNLNERERYIVENRLMAEEPKTLQEIGERFRITRERARQIEENLKTKLRKTLAQRALPAAA